MQRKKEEEAQSKEEECQRKLAYHLEVDHVATAEKQRHKNWTKTFLPLTTPPSDKEMNLIDLLPLTKRQHIQYLPQETPEACQRCEELAREIGMSAVGGKM